MKKFLIWLGIAVASFLGLGLTTHLVLSAAPSRVIIAVDTSYAMGVRASEIQDTVARFVATRYTSSTLLTDKGLVVPAETNDAWRKSLRFYGPANLEGFLDQSRQADLQNAQKMVFLVHASSQEAIARLKARYGGAQFIEFN